MSSKVFCSSHFYAYHVCFQIWEMSTNILFFNPRNYSRLFAITYLVCFQFCKMSTGIVHFYPRKFARLIYIHIKWGFFLFSFLHLGKSAGILYLIQGNMLFSFLNLLCLLSSLENMEVHCLFETRICARLVPIPVHCVFLLGECRTASFI